MSKIYIYKMTADNGGAPCVHCGRLSLFWNVCFDQTGSASAIREVSHTLQPASSGVSHPSAIAEHCGPRDSGREVPAALKNGRRCGTRRVLRRRTRHEVGLGFKDGHPGSELRSETRQEQAIFARVDWYVARYNPPCL